MSWSLSTGSPAVSLDDAPAALDKAIDNYKASFAVNDVELDAAAVEQIEKAKAVALDIAGSGVVGSGTFYFVISGHANPEHKPVKGWANDALTVQVTCGDPQPIS